MPALKVVLVYHNQGNHPEIQFFLQFIWACQGPIPRGVTLRFKHDRVIFLEDARQMQGR